MAEDGAAAEAVAEGWGCSCVSVRLYVSVRAGVMVGEGDVFF